MLAGVSIWREWARPEQLEPEEPFRVWAINGGRGSGKTRSGSEFVQENVVEGRARRVALVGRTVADVRDVMVEGPSGILKIAPPWARPVYYPSKRRLVWHCLGPVLGYVPEAFCYSADKPDQLRGPEHDLAWADELAAWRHFAAWINLQLGLRQGENPRTIVTTTPRPLVALKKLYAKESTIVTGSTTYENAANLADSFLTDLVLEYHGTSIGRQELLAEMLEEAEGSLWERAWIDDNRVDERDSDGRLIIPELDGVVVAVDPAVTAKATSDETGIIVCGRGKLNDGEDGAERVHYYVIDDASGRLKPSQWATRAVDLRQWYEADYIVGEVNNGGDLVEFTIQTIDDTELFKEVRASRGKVPRAGPVAAAASQGRVHHVGPFDELEDQLCNWVAGATPEHPNDRLDAMVWGITQLMPKSRRRPVTGGLALGGLQKQSYFRPRGG